MLKQGDQVWIRVKVGLSLSDGTAWYSDLRGKPIKGNFDARHIQDSPALPALCQWFLETPWSFEMAAGLLMAFSEERPPFPPYLEALKALVVALAPFDPDAADLTPEAGDTGARS